jgi:DNA polymerase III subunit alpha
MIFNHLHVHTQYSLLDGAAEISKLFNKAKEDGMRGLAITDHGNMFGVFNFVAEAWKHKASDGSLAVKPIVGCEFYLVQDRHQKQFTREQRDLRYHQLLLAKNAEGYKNLSKLCSLGYIEGFYGKYPRIDKELILQYHSGLIATTCCLGAEIPRTILKEGEAAAEEKFKWWLDLFGSDYYVEIQRHKIPEQEKVNEVLLRFAAKYNVPVIASNDSHYVDRDDYVAHDILLCVNTGAKKADPSFKDFGDEDGGIPKGARFAFYNDEFYFKKTAEMESLFSDIPQAIDNTNEIVDKVETLNLNRDILLPNFPVPPEFTDQNAYLRHLTYEGAKSKYGEIDDKVKERIDFELHVIETMGFAGYFLIVADFIRAGRDMGVFIGPGRGSAAGSAVAYCTGITNIDPIKYDLLFERFLNPERASMPDIDTDFDDAGRQKVIDYVVEKYGRSQVAHIITYSSMAAKASIKDVARVLDLPLAEANALTKMVPDNPGISLKRVIHAPLDGPGSLSEKEGVRSDDFAGVTKLRELYNQDGAAGEVLREAVKLEGSIRGTGIHAAGIIIAPEDLTNLIPIANAKDTDLLVTQYDGGVVESAGVIKMDFLGLKTLSIIKEALRLIEMNHGINIDVETIPLDDSKTYELFQQGRTNAVFQFESQGMQKVLIQLKPDRLEDLIAVNALYRPGPMDYIPEFVERKFGRKPIVYDLAEMEDILKETYGITVYQEQVMLLSNKLAGFSKGMADTIRKAMGKKKRDVLDKLKPQFLDGCESNGHNRKIAEKVWTDWEAFASYAFNKSHATCYAYVAYQTAYLKAHYPSEYMAAVLSNNLSDMKKINFFMEECRRMGIAILGPSVNDSLSSFSVDGDGTIRFGLAAIKGVGEGAVELIIQDRLDNGPYESVYDFLKRSNLRAISKRVIENLVLAGALDCFKEANRAQYFAKDVSSDQSWLERLTRWASAFQQSKQSTQVSLFGDTEEIEVQVPEPPQVEEWAPIVMLAKEKEVTGFYISGHPFDEFKNEIRRFSTTNLVELNELNELKGKNLEFPGIVVEVAHRTNKAGKPFGIFKLEDFLGSLEFRLFGEDYLKYKHYLEVGTFLFIHAAVQSRFRNSDDLELKINKMSLLQDLKDRVKFVTLQVNVEDIEEGTAEKLETLFKKYPGNTSLNIRFVENKKNYIVESKSQSVKISTDNELFLSINQLRGCSISL